MKMPEFPKGFVQNHCSKVLEARYWRKLYKVKDLTEADDTAFAECAFYSAGVGMQCESCQLFLTRPMRTEAEKQWLEAIEDYYEQMAEYEKWLERDKIETEKIQQTLGSGI